jgi:mRNA-degrading endonuclease YafQ of YafQ-DinJ toxin-antitoxin module
MRTLIPPPAPPLETHKLKGKLRDSWACDAGYDLRIVFDFIKKQGQGEDDILLLGMGSHEEVY